MPLKTPATKNSAGAESRTATRFRQEPKTVFAILQQPQCAKSRVEVHDESLFGICLTMADTRGLQVGDEVELSYCASLMHGTVKHITPCENGVFLVGLATSAPLSDCSPAGRSDAPRAG